MTGDPRRVELAPRCRMRKILPLGRMTHRKSLPFTKEWEASFYSQSRERLPYRMS